MVKYEIDGAAVLGGAARLEDRDGVGGDEGLHEAREAEDRVVEARGGQVLLHAVLEVHERHVLVLVALVDGEEDVALDAHDLRHLDEGALRLPVHLPGRARRVQAESQLGPQAICAPFPNWFPLSAVE